MICIAAVLKSNGTEGELLIGLHGICAEDIHTEEPVFVDCDGLPVPYFIESLTPRGNSKALVRLTGVRSLDDAQELCGKKINVRPQDYPDLEEDEDLQELIGWTVLDQDGRTAGTISAVEEIPGNPCIEIKTENGQGLVPLSEELLLSVNSKKRILKMQIPEGLL